MNDNRLRNLRERTNGRDEAIWQPFDFLGLGLTEIEDFQNRVFTGGTEQLLAIIDAEMDAETTRRDLLHEADLAEVSQERRNIWNRISTQKKALAIKQAGDLLVMAAREYDAQVKAVIMAAREYAAAVEKEQIELERLRAEMAVKKEELRVQDIYARVFFEIVEQKQLEAEKAKTQVEVARANIRALMAEIEAEETELRIIQEELDVVMTEAEKATLNADIALIIADITTRCLAGIRLGVEEAEISEAREYIQRHLDDTLALWERRTLIENIRRDAEIAIQAEIWRYLEKQKEQENLRILDAQSDLRVTRKDIETVLAKAQEEGMERLAVGLARAVAVAAKSRASIMVTEAKEASETAENQAYETVYQHSEHTEESVATIEQNIYG